MRSSSQPGPHGRRKIAQLRVRVRPAQAQQEHRQPLVEVAILPQLLALLEDRPEDSLDRARPYLVLEKAK